MFVIEFENRIEIKHNEIASCVYGIDAIFNAG